MFEITTPAYQFECPPDCNWLPSPFELLAAAEERRSELKKAAPPERLQRPNLIWNEEPNQGPDWPSNA
ncbi:MAG: hypothetical protein GY748_00350 [Planctomycetaceae bacterium]|nr:hypothetical protein [Planctomycetaceae bacterium]